MHGYRTLGDHPGIRGVIFLIAGLAQAAQNRSYAACSEKVSATVTHKTSRKVKNGRVYELNVAYEVDGTAYEKWIGVSADAYEACDVGSRYEICCKPQNPKHAVDPRNLNPRNARTVLIIGAALTAVGIAMFLISR